MTENRFVELDRQVRRIRGNYSIPRIAGMQSFSPFSFPLAATDRALIVLIDNGGIDLQLGDVVDRLLALVPGGSVLPDSARQGIVNALHDKIKSVTKNLLETAELTLNRYSAAKPDLYGDILVLRDGTATYADLKQALITQTAQTAVCNRHHSLDQQLCRWMLLSLDRLQTNEIVMTQELIANMLGVRREGVTGAAGKLQKAGLISYKRGKINIIDRGGLEKRTCECYAVVKNEYDRLLPPARPEPVYTSTPRRYWHEAAAHAA